MVSSMSSLLGDEHLALVARKSAEGPMPIQNQHLADLDAERPAELEQKTDFPVVEVLRERVERKVRPAERFLEIEGDCPMLHRCVHHVTSPLDDCRRL